MANRGIWSLFGSNPTTLLSGATLNALANNTMSAASATYANQTNLDLYCDIEVFLDTLPGTASSGAYVAIYILAAVDGTNFPAQSASDLRLTTTQLFCVIPTGITSGSTQRVAARNLLLPPQPVQFKIDNQTGQAFAATANNTVKIDAYSYNLNG
jgi:hypothetical protein